MSDYGKLKYSDASEYDSSQSGQDPMYLSYVQPSFSQPHAHSSSAQYERHVDQVPYAPSALYQPHAQIEGSQSSYIDPPSRQIPEVSSFSPQQGPLGTQVYIKITASYDLLAPPVVIFSVMFARKRCRSIISRADGGGPYCHYLLATEAPPFASTGWAKAQVPLRLHFQDDSGIGAGAIEVGSYTYTDAMQQSQTSPPEFTRKRKISFESADITGLPAKRTSAQHLHPGALDPYGPYSHQLQGNSGYLQKPQSFGTDSSLGNLNPYNRPSSQQSYRLQDSPRRVSHHLSTSSASSLSQLRAPSPQTPSWSPARSSISQQNRSPALAVTPATRISSVPSPNKSNPPLIRTSTLQQSPSPAATPVGPTTAGSFNPYAMYPHKAVLKINGDLGTMAENWVSEEWDARRRLVQFWRSQSGSTINTHFKPVSPEDRLPNSICISCIWWEQKKECYVTSVDTIYLLESLVAVRFTVEEKNRIRRNLEGFHPMTVSKGKSDSEDFFKLIMGFPNPKPRNIEKDVKVFPWKVLSHALKKIIGKYSASYSSTAGALLAPVGSSYGSATQPSTGTESHATASPHSASESSTCNAYTAALTSTSMSPNVSYGRLSIPYTSAGQPLLQVSAPLAHAYAAPTQLYQYTSQSHMTPSSAEAPMMPQVQRGSWDYSSFIESSPASTTPANPQIYHYQHDSLDLPTTQEVSGAQYQMTHTSAGS